MREYEKLVTRFHELRERLGEVVSALDVERVAHTIMREKKIKEASEWQAKRERKGSDVSIYLQKLNDESAAFMGKGFATAETERKVDTRDDVAMDGGGIATIKREESRTYE